MRLHLLQHARIATLLLALCACLLALPSTTHAATQGCADDVTAVTDLTSSWQAQLLSLTNAHRATLDLAALSIDTTLTNASMWKARDMARRNYFSHDDPANGSAPARDPWERLEECGWTSGGARAENIAAGYGSAAQVIQGWLDSPGHRANIENPSMRYVGFGVANSTTSSYGTYQVQMFASVAGPASTTPFGSATGGGDGTDGSGGDSGSGGDRELRSASAVRTQQPRITRTRCRTRLAVRGWCYRLHVRGTVTVAGVPAVGRPVRISRRSAAGRLLSLASVRTTSTGSFTRVVGLRPPARGTTTWLRRNATRIRVSVAGTAEAAPSIAWATARLQLAR